MAIPNHKKGAAICPSCLSEKTIKSGIRKLKLQTLQRFKCTSCNKYFQAPKIRSKTYPAKMILEAVSTYNLGNTLEETKNAVSRHFKITIPKSTIHSWVDEYKNTCPFHKIRDKAMELSA